MKYISKVSLAKKRVLLRACLDTPRDPVSKKIVDDFRLRSSLPTIKLLLEQGCGVIVCGKLGRPQGKKQEDLSIQQVAQKLAELLGMEYAESNSRASASNGSTLVFYTGDLKSEKSRVVLQSVGEGQVCVLENLEFYQEELENNTKFAKDLASIAEAFVNDDFAKCHHPTASTVGVAEFLPSYAGLQLEKEILGLNQVMGKPSSPFILMMGGIKISDKAKTLSVLGRKADYILLAGGLANLFFKAKGYEVGQSKVETEQQQLAWQMLQNFKERLELPQDVVVAKSDQLKDTIRVCAPHEVSAEEQILDIGPKTMLRFASLLKTASTIVWNGPLGYFEVKPFHHGTLALAKVVGGRAQGKAFAVAGGGETVDAVRLAGQEQMLDLLSTGGGAMLEYLSGEILPGVKALQDNKLS